MSANKTLMLMMESWTEKETPKLSQGKQTHKPYIPGGKTLGAMGPKKKGKDGGGKRMARRKTWREDIKATASSNA